jgi:hypothetical protein
MSAELQAQPITTNRWVLGARPRTLPAAVAPVLVGTAVGVWTSVGAEDRFSFIAWRFICALIVAVAVQVATNYANDYSDGKRGIDDPGKRVGPPRLVGDGLATPDEVKRAMLVAFGVTLLAGAPLVILVDWRLGLVGVASVAAGWFYTGGANPYGYAGLGEVFVFVFFGLVATVFSAYVQSGQITLLAFGAGAAMGLLATALLVINTLDIPAIPPRASAPWPFGWPPDPSSMRCACWAVRVVDVHRRELGSPGGGGGLCRAAAGQRCADPRVPRRRRSGVDQGAGTHRPGAAGLWGVVGGGPGHRAGVGLGAPTISRRVRRRRSGARGGARPTS